MTATTSPDLTPSAIAALPETPQRQTIRAILARYGGADARAAWLQLANTFVPFGLCWMAMLASLDMSYGLTLLLALPTTGFLLRIFGIQHDCGHNSFFPSKRANETLGFICSLFTLTPYHYWKRAHAYHHAHVGHLDHRDLGYFDLKTVREYDQLPPWRQRLYRWYQHPLVLFGIGPTLKFLVLQRLTSHIPADWHKERRNVRVTNLLLLAIALLAAAAIGWQTLLLVHLPVVVLTSAAGVWIFYIQHVYEDTYWERDRWDYTDACFASCSYYALPRVLEWCALYNNIHHIHHFDSRIPNYRIAACFRDNPELQNVKHVSLRESLSCAGLGLWDEDRQRLIRFRDLPRAASS